MQPVKLIVATFVHFIWLIQLNKKNVTLGTQNILLEHNST